MISPEKIESLKEHLSNFAKYQWIKTERAGTITEFLNVAIEQDGAVWIEFMDGSRCKYELLNEFMIKTNNEYELLDVEKPLIPEQKTNVSNVAVRANQKPAVVDSPIHTLLKKQKPNLVNIDFTVELNIPSAELYNVICESFENAPDEIVSHIVSSLDIEMIKTSVKNAISNFYEKVDSE